MNAQSPATPGGQQGNSQQNLNQIVSCLLLSSRPMRDSEGAAHVMPGNLFDSGKWAAVRASERAKVNFASLLTT